MQWILLVFGGAIGVSIRYIIIHQYSNTPSCILTLTVNIIGSFLIGIFFALTEIFTISPMWRTAIQIGLLGGLTTFSSFSLEILQFIHAGRYSSIILYIITSVFFCILFAWIGWIITQKIFA